MKEIITAVFVWCLIGFLLSLVAKRQSDSVTIDTKLKWMVACLLGAFWILPIILIFYIENIE